MLSNLITPDEMLLTLGETADTLRCSKVTLWKLRKEGKLKETAVRGKTLIKLSDVKTYLKSTSKEAVAHESVY